MDTVVLLCDALRAPGVRDVLRAVSGEGSRSLRVLGQDGSVLVKEGEETEGEVASRSVSLGGKEIGRVVIASGGGLKGSEEAEVAARIAAACIETRLEAESQMEGLTGEIVERYEEINLLYDLTSELSGLFDEMAIARHAVNTIAHIVDVETAAILLHNEEAGRFVMAALGGTAPVFDQHIVGPDDRGLLGELAERREPIIANSRGELPDRVIEEEKYFPISGILAAPLLHLAGTEDEVLIGVAIVCGKRSGIFCSGDEKLVGAICSQAATSIYSTRMFAEHKDSTLLRRDMDLAEQIQSTMLPDKAPEVAGADIAGQCVTAVNVGGDYFDYITNSEGAVTILLGDVTGHSLGAALMMTAARATLRSIVSEAGGPAEVIRRTNALLYNDLDSSDLMISLFAGHYVPATRKLLYASAGHNPPFLIRNGSVEGEPLDPTGIILGVMPDADYDVKYHNLEPGDIVFFYTDGVTEAMDENREQFGEKRLVRVLCENSHRSANDIMIAVSRAVQVWMGSGKPTDDITSVVLKINE